jgi:glycosyltransferase involved in cell wall biosynthesis
MKIMQISPYFPPHLGGVEYHVKGLSDGLAKRGYDICVASSCGNGNFEFAHVPSIDLFYVPLPLPLRLPKVEADVFHSHVPSPAFAFFFRKLSPHIVTYHNDIVVPQKINGHSLPMPLRTSLERLNEKFIQPVLDGAKIILATTRSYAETSPILRNHAHKIRIVPNAVDLSAYPVGRKKEKFIVFAGRMVEYKGIGTLLDAMKEVQKKEALRLVLLGDGYDRHMLEARARRMGIDAFFAGRVGRSNLIDILSRAQMLILPSTSRLEAFGIVLLEAMACETPVLAFDTPGVNEIAKEGGFVFSDMAQLAERILELHHNEPLRRSMGKRGRMAVESKYSWSKVLDQIEAVYREVT